jgi:NADH-quinone oxidoreductase subunit G
MKCTINGVELEVQPGTSVIQAMMDNEQRIAHYCWHPGLSVAGVCRMCMIEIDGNPRPQIACNTTITEGMKINNTSEKIVEATKWALDFHLINHPLDCPVCDQAGECGLQEQYMEYGKYDPEMAEQKQKKNKVVDLGPTVVLDSERCILCSRCVRFTDEVSKTNELGIFNRGDRSEVGTHAGKSLDNNYSLNTVDICPVGALTSKDFRFRQRVWYLKDAETVCNGCSTGCSVKVYFNKEGFYRVKPVHNAEVNGHWMCDEGRDLYKHVNIEHRMTKGQKLAGGQVTEMSPGAVAKDASVALKASGGAGTALVLTGQYSIEEYQHIVTQFKKDLACTNVFHWINNPETFDSFDGLLLRGDRNPNTKGLLKVLSAESLSGTWKDLISKIQSGVIKTVVVAGPENPEVFKDLEERI